MSSNWSLRRAVELFVGDWTTHRAGPVFGYLRDVCLLMQLALTGSPPPLEADTASPRLYVHMSGGLLWSKAPPRPRWHARIGQQWLDARITATVAGAGSVFADGAARVRRVMSGASAHAYTPGSAHAMTERDVLHTPASTWEGLGADASAEELEHLLCAATAPQLRIPLLLEYVSRDHVSLLFSPGIRRLMAGALFEPGLWLPDGVGVSTELPARVRTDAQRSRHGLLIEELQRTPGPTLQPLMRIAEAICTMCGNADVGAGCVTTMLWLARILVDVRGYLASVEVQSTAASADGDAVVAFLHGPVTQALHRWIQQATLARNLAQCVLLRAHLVLVVASGVVGSPLSAEDVSDMLGSVAFVTMWHGCNHDVTYASAAAQRLEPLVPVGPMMYAFERRRGDVLRWFEGATSGSTNSHDANRVLTHVASCATSGQAAVSSSTDQQWRAVTPGSTVFIPRAKGGVSSGVAVDIALAQCTVRGGALRPVPDIIRRHADFKALFPPTNDGGGPMFCAVVPPDPPAGDCDVPSRFAFAFSRSGVDYEVAAQVLGTASTPAANGNALSMPSISATEVAPLQAEFLGARWSACAQRDSGMTELMVATAGLLLPVLRGDSSARWLNAKSNRHGAAAGDPLQALRHAGGMLWAPNRSTPMDGVDFLLTAPPEACRASGSTDTTGPSTGVGSGGGYGAMAQWQPPAWFVVTVVTPLPDVAVSVYQLITHGSTVHTRCVFVSDTTRSVAEFPLGLSPDDSAAREKHEKFTPTHLVAAPIPPPTVAATLPPRLLHHSAGRLNLAGPSVSSDAKGDRAAGLSIQVFRMHRAMDADTVSTEKWLPPRCVAGVVPQCLVEAFDFWWSVSQPRTGETRSGLATGVRKPGADTQSYDYSLSLAVPNGSGRGKVTRVFNGAQKQARGTVLLDVCAPPSTNPSVVGLPLATIRELLVGVESPSHMLVWGTDVGDGSFRVDSVELPRLRTSFQVRQDGWDASGTNPVFRLYSVDCAGSYVVDQRCEGVFDAVRATMASLPHGVLLMDDAGVYTAFVPNFDARPRLWKQSPLRRDVALDRCSPSWKRVMTPRYVMMHWPCNGTGFNVCVD